MKRYLIPVIFLIFFVLACRKDSHDHLPASSITPPDSLSLAAVQNWYRQQTVPNSLNAARGPVISRFSLSKLNFDWAKASNIHDQKRNWWIVSLPGQPTFQGVKQGYRKLAFTRDSTGSIKVNILEIIPDAAYLFIHRKAETRTFTGHVFVYDQNYQLTGGMIFHDGKQVGQIRPAASALATIPVPSSGNKKLKPDYAYVDATCDWVNANYIDSEHEPAIYSYQVCDYTIYDDGYGGGSDGIVPTGDPLGSGGGGGGSVDAAPAITVLPDQGNPNIDPKAFLNCFGTIPDAGASETVTVYVVEPQPGMPFNVGTNSVGHTAISLSKTNQGQTITQTLGFYPNDTKLAATGSQSKVVDNGYLGYTVSITYKVLPFEFNAIINFLSSPNSTYNLYTYNCTNFVYNACLAGGITLPDPTGNLGMFITGMSPAALGASIRTVAPDMNVNLNGGTVSQSHGPCN